MTTILLFIRFKIVLSYTSNNSNKMYVRESKELLGDTEYSHLIGNKHKGDLRVSEFTLSRSLLEWKKKSSYRIYSTPFPIQ